MQLQQILPDGPPLSSTFSPRNLAKKARLCPLSVTCWYDLRQCEALQLLHGLLQLPKQTFVNLVGKSAILLRICGEAPTLFNIFPESQMAYPIHPPVDA